MFKHYLKIALKHLLKNKLYSAINIIGLAVGLAACLLIMLFVRDEFSYDDFWPNADNIYRLQQAFHYSERDIITTKTSGLAKAAIEEYFPEDIASSTRIYNSGVTIKQGDRVFSDAISMVDKEFVDIFQLDVVAGDLKATLSDTSSLAISESFSKKYFGDTNPIGKIFKISSGFFDRDYHIGAVFKDLPENTTLAFEALAIINDSDFDKMSWVKSWSSVSVHTFFTLKAGTSLTNVDSQLSNLLNKYYILPRELTDKKASEVVSLSTLPLTDIQLRSVGIWPMKPVGTMATVLILISTAGLILLIACINFVNLSTARSLQRAREVVLRKVLGARRQQIIVQFMSESLLTALVGLLLGLVLMELALPAYNSFLDRSLVFHYLDGAIIAILLGLVAVVGLLAGLYPALIISGFLPAQVLKANKTTETAGSVRLRKALVTLQFSVSIFLIITTAVVYGQMLFSTSRDPGFNRDNLVSLYNVARPEVLEKQQTLKERISQLPGIVNLAYSTNSPSSTSESNTIVTLTEKPDLGRLQMGIQGIGYDFLATYQIPLLAGRNYSRDFSTDGYPEVPENHDGSLLTGTTIINESAVSVLGYSSPDAIIGHSIRTIIGRTPDGFIYGDLTIIGVIPDISFRSLRWVVSPEIYSLSGEGGFFDNGTLAISFSGDPLLLIQQLEALWQEMFPDTPFVHWFVDKVMLAEFKKEQDLATTLGFFSLLAITIAGLGLYGLAAFTAERRTKEIGIRKVLGAGVMDIVRLLIWQFSKPVLIAVLIAWPIAVWAMVRWLETFPYRLDTWILLPVCLLAAVLVFVVAWVTVGGNTAKVARENPIKALRYE